ncbi:MAG: radical SAM protein [Paludibacter sp.]|nr:radical SAM protein [Paludibacter sp.]
MKIILVTPPLTQLNTPYPATTQLTGFLKSQNIDVVQADLSIELIASIFNKKTLKEVFDIISQQNKIQKKHRIILQNTNFYVQNIEPVMRFLSDRDSTLAKKFSQSDFWPVKNRIGSEDDLEWAFGTIGNHDRATHLCTLFIKDIAEIIQKYIDPHFELIRYAESLCQHLPDFEPLETELHRPLSFINDRLLEIFKNKIEKHEPQFIGFSVPFPGNLLSALQCAKWLKDNHPDIKIIFGGGYVNTELRQISDAEIFKYIDYLTFDDGELPLLRIIQNGELIRTLTCENDEIIRHNFDSRQNVRFSKTGTPDYENLLGNNYINLIEMTNPMHSLWSNGRWNKLILAHGCYWGKCAFCDGSLDYIKRFEPAPVSLLVDRMESIMEQTGISGFHFVDEAAPPAILRKLAEEIIRRKLTVSYWTNIRFDKVFDTELCYVLAQSGCIAVSGGLEVAAPRILKMINKGITIETASECMKNLTNAGIMTHAYLMYGFPTETAKETIDSLEVVRGLFENGYLHSAFWHRYAMTIHSPSGIEPEKFGAVKRQNQYNRFANNEVPFSTENPIDLDYYGRGLNLATYNYMNGTGFDIPVRKWFKN